MNKNKVTKVLGYLFSVTSTFPVAIPVVLTLIILITKGKFLYDFMMPAELILFTIFSALGIIILEVVNKKSFSEYKKLVLYLSLSVINFLVANIYANFTGLAHGDTELTGIHLIFIVIFIILWHLFAILTSIECFILTKKLT
ncbi:MAG: hypothetical protein J7J43_03890 [Thermosipho sp. (in: Bacteria)]|nr:hypothetical protein [Thermosipho sp. (in: thermotogales)]